MKLLIVGCGNMGSALLKCWKNEYTVETIDPLSPTIGKDFSDIQGTFDIIVLAVKPNVFSKIKDACRQYCRKDTIIVSVMACIQTTTLSEAFPENTVVRAMPNLAVQNREGMTCLYTSAHTAQEKIEPLFKLTGECIWLSEEEMIDTLTVFNGSGPGIFFAFCEKLSEICCEYGLPQAQAENLIRQTFIGSAALAKNSQLPFSELVKKVATPGGVTEAALNVLNPSIPQILRESVEMAIKRTKQ